MSEEVSLPPLVNGLDYMASTVAALQPDRESSELKYAILHLSAAIEVISKYRLALEYWTMAVSSASLNKTTRSKFSRGEFKSVTLDEALERLQNLLDVQFAPRELEAVKNAQALRNQLQHFGVESNAETIEGVAVAALSFLLSFVEREVLWRIPEPELQGVKARIEEIQTGLGTIEALVKVRMDELRIILDQRASAVVQCPTCNQMALEIEGSGTASCHFCTQFFESAGAVEDYVLKVQGMSSYESIKDGVEDPLSWCPDCMLDTVARGVETRAGKAWLFCFCCGERFGGACLICGSPIGDPAKEGFACRDCFDYRVMKDD